MQYVSQQIIHSKKGTHFYLLTLMELSAVQDRLLGLVWEAAVADLRVGEQGGRSDLHTIHVSLLTPTLGNSHGFAFCDLVTSSDLSVVPFLPFLVQNGHMENIY